MSEVFSPREVGLKWFQEVWNTGRLDLIDQLLAPEALGHLEGGQDITGPAEFIDFRDAITAAFSGFHLDVLRVMADGENVCVHWKMTGEHTGESFGLPPTGNIIEATGMTWLVVRDGRIVEGWDSWNQGALMARLSGMT